MSSCPFYGKRVVPGGFAEGEMKNQCALNYRGVSPCELELRGRSVKWKRCYYASAKGSVGASIEQAAEIAGLVFKRKFKRKKGLKTMNSS